MTELLPDAVQVEPPAAQGRPFYLALEPVPVFATLHLAPAPSSARTAVLLCPAFGWDELASHRSMRAFAGALAEAGLPALRFDLPATGDSGGTPRDPGLLETWTRAVAAAAVALRQSTGAERTVAVGIGLGGMLACRAAAHGAAIDDLVLWAVPPRGSLFLRELRAFARMFAENADGDAGEEYAGADGSLNGLGFVLAAETIAELEALDLLALTLPDADTRRVLLLGRDDAQVDRRLQAHFAEMGAAVTTAAGTGYGAMMVDPQFSRYPREVFAATIAWLAEEDGSAAAVPGRGGAEAVATSDTVELTVGGAVVRETPFVFRHRGERLAGVLTEPGSGARAQAPLCGVLLNPGGVRRIGHNRQYVEAARRWAARGVPSLRFDVTGVGDSDGAEGLYSPRGSFQRRELSEQVRTALDELEGQGFPPRFIVGGVCSGAYWGLHAALADPRVRGLLLVNLLAFHWSSELGASRDARRARALLREHDLLTIIRIVAVDRWRVRRMLRTSRTRPGSRRNDDSDQSPFEVQVVDVLNRLRDGGVQTLLLLSLDEPLYDDLVAFGLIDRLDEWPGLHLERIETTGHVFRSLWAQREMHRALDDALERTLSEVGNRSETG
jgi:pimeloyl-ACP methyl ester carboxylesterase